MIHSLVLLVAALASPGGRGEPELPKVLFFANPMRSDNDVVRRPRPEVLSVAERHFDELSKGVFDVTITQDGSEVTRESLARYKAVVFFTAINPPGVDVEGLVDWVREGGAFVGIHSTANTYQGHPAFGAMLGARFDRRPWRTKETPQTKVRVRVDDRTHPATRHLDASFEIADDIYQYKDFDRDKVRLLLSLDPASLDRGNPRFNREDRNLPVSWAKDHGKGRVFYTALGDWESTWKDPLYRTHLVAGIRWAMGIEGGRRPSAPPAARHRRRQEFVLQFHMYVKLCFYCKREFESSHPLANICSTGCGLRKSTRRTPKTSSVPRKVEPEPRKVEPEPRKAEPEPRKARPESRKAKPETRIIEIKCQRCGAVTQDATGTRKFCSTSCRRATARMTRQERLRRRYVEPVSMSVLRQRDNDTCRLCGEPVDFTKQQPDPRAASIDHVIALTNGGEHSYQNTQLAHYCCNVAKGAG